MQTKDWSLRHEILGIPDPKSMTECDCIMFWGDDGRPHWFGGTDTFTGLSVGAMHTLVELGSLDLNGYTNNSPTAEAFLRFMEKYPMFTAIGYAVHPARQDARITIEGIETTAPLNGAALKAFTDFAEEADEFDAHSSHCRCWWD